MGLDSLLQKGKKHLRRTLLAGLASTLFLSCAESPTEPPPKPEPPVHQNRAPQTEIAHEFGDDGSVLYTFTGTDPDGSLDYISIQVNQETALRVNNNYSRLVYIIEGMNNVTATAYDNEGLADPTPAEYSFVSPTNSQARATIEEILNARASLYEGFEKDVLLSLGAEEGFYVDFLIIKKDSTNAVVNYVGHEKNSTEELINQNSLNTFGIPNLYLFMLPENEIMSKLNGFINNGFN